MKTFLAALTAAAFLECLLLSTTAAVALGGCGYNGHRNIYGRCVFGGQNQNYCLRTKGHPAVRMPDGTYRCI